MSDPAGGRATRVVTTDSQTSPNAGSAILTVEHLTKVFGRSGREHKAVDDLSFHLDEGESLAIVGESGSGKTTTARIVAGLETATSGRVVMYALYRAADRRELAGLDRPSRLGRFADRLSGR